MAITKIIPIVKVFFNDLFYQLCLRGYVKKKYFS